MPMTAVRPAHAAPGVKAGALHNPVVRGILLAVFATMCFSLADTVSKHLVRDYPGTMIVWARYAVPVLLMIAVLGPRRGRGLLRTGHPREQILRGALMMGATLCMVFALRAMPIAEAQAISFVHPLLLTVMAVAFLGERVRPLGWVAVALGFVGVLIIIRPGGGLFTPVALLPLGMAVCFSAYQILTRRIAQRETAINSLFYMLLVGAVVMSAVQPFAWVAPDLSAAAMLLLVGVLAGGGHFCMIKALQHAPASLLAPFAYGQLVWVTALGVVVFGDFPDAVTLVGIAVVVAGGLLVAVERKRRG